MRDQDHDRKLLVEAVKQAGIDDIVYVTPNHYDGGYEVRIGTQDVFVEYATLDAKDLSWLDKLHT